MHSMRENDKDIEASLRTGERMVFAGIAVLVAAFIGTCGAVISGASSGTAHATVQGLQIGQSPWLLSAMTIGIALIAFGQVRKSNARRDAKERYLGRHTSLEVEPNDESQGAPYRPGAKQVEVLDPIIAAAEQEDRERSHQRGGRLLGIGCSVIAITVMGMLWVIVGNEGGSARQNLERGMTAFGLAVFPFCLGMYFAIKGLLLRSK